MSVACSWKFERFFYKKGQQKNSRGSYI